jgi:hypothetical protein
MHSSPPAFHDIEGKMGVRNPTGLNILLSQKRSGGAIGWQYPDHGLRLPNIIHRLGTGGLDCPVPAATNAKMLRRPSKCEC